MARAASLQGERLEFQTLVNQALAQHPSLQSRNAELGAAESDVQAARWQFWPTPSVLIERPDKALIAGTDRQVTLLSLRQPLWTGGRLQAQLGQAQARQQVIEAVRQETLKDIVLDLVQSYGEALVATKRVLAFETSHVTHLKMLELIRRRAHEGVSNDSEIYLAQSRLQAIEADLAQARAQRYVALQKISAHTGQTLPASASLADMSPLDSQAPTADVGQALLIDPTLRRLKAEAADLEANLQVKDAELWPEIYASLTQRRGDVTGQNTAVAVGLQSRWGGGLSSLSALEAARLRHQAKEGELNFRVRKLSEQVLSDEQLLTTARERAKSYRLALQDSRWVAESWDRQFMAGKKSWQDVVNAVREVTQLEVQLAEAQVLAGVSAWRLAVLTQGTTAVLQPRALGDKP